MKTFETSLVLMFAASLAYAADPNVVTREASGQAAIVKGDEAKAVDEATKNALRTVVEQAAGVLITADTTTLNSTLVRDQVYSHASGYVKKFDVLSKKVEKGVVTVTVKAEVLTAALDKDLAAVKTLIGRLGRTRLLLVIQEQSIDNKGIAQRGEILSSRLTDSFRRDGWKIIDEKGTVAEGAMKVSSGVGTGTLDAKEIGRKTDADYIVYGSVNLRFVPPTDKGGLIAEVDSASGKQLMFYVLGDYDLSMFETRTGTNLGKIANKMSFKEMSNMRDIAKLSKSYEESASVLCTTEAPRIVSELRAPVLEFIRNRDVNGYEIAVTVDGLADFASAQEFKKALAEIKDVKEVKNRDFKGGKAQYDVSFLGTADDFGTAIGATTTFRKKRLSVTAVQNNTVEVSIAK